MTSILFEDIFKITEKDPIGKQFIRVSRLHCESESFKVKMILDVNTWIYPLNVHEKFRLILADNLTGNENSNGVDYYTSSIEGTIADSFECVMYGKIYRVDGHEFEIETTELKVYVSFGGLLMQLKGNVNSLNAFELNKYVYLLIKRLAY